MKVTVDVDLRWPEVVTLPAPATAAMLEAVRENLDHIVNAAHYISQQRTGSMR